MTEIAADPGDRTKKEKLFVLSRTATYRIHLAVCKRAYRQLVVESSID